MIKIKDTKDSYFQHGGLLIQSCDVDMDGNIESVDIIVDGQFQYCVNIQDSSPESYLLRDICYHLFPKEN